MPVPKDIRHWPTLDAFAAHLAAHDPAICAWVKGVTVHHTVIPTVAQWDGRRTMDGMLRFYEDKGWDGAPHLFVAPDGIWQMNPLNLPGIHAGRCNVDHWGVEVVGNYDRITWREPIRSFAYGAIVALLHWRGLGADAVKGHRECLNNKSCPGTAINMNDVRANVAVRLAAVPPAPPAPAPVPLPVPVAVYTADSPLIASPRASAAQALAYILARAHGEYTTHDIAGVIVPAYWAVCERAGIDPVLAVAQMIHETGNLTSFWSHRPRRNPAGIGVTGRRVDQETYQKNPERYPPELWAYNRQRMMWEAGVSFPTWKDDAIPAHIGRLLLYALPAGAGTPAQQALIADALAWRPFPADFRGTAPTLKPLGKVHNPKGSRGAGWAHPGDNYGAAIARIANAIAATEAL